MQTGLDNGAAGVDLQATPSESRSPAAFSVITAACGSCRYLSFNGAWVARSSSAFIGTSRNWPCRQAYPGAGTSAMPAAPLAPFSPEFPMSDPLLVSPVPGVSLKRVEANGISMRYAEAGSGPLVLFCHGGPESWYSWRHQLQAVAAAGYRAVAPDMRGYGGTDAPEAIDQYTLFHIVGDMVELVKTLGEEQAVIVGHDWGAPAAWHAALWRPDVFRAVAGMSVPWSPPGYTDLLSALAKLGITTFYIQYFQNPGVAEAELQKDVRNSLRRVYFTAGGELREQGKGFAVLPPGGGLLDNTVDPQTLPPWMVRPTSTTTRASSPAGFAAG